MKTYPMVVRFGGASSQGHIKEMTAAQIGISEAAMDYQALKNAYAFIQQDSWWRYEQRAFARQRMARP